MRLIDARTKITLKNILFPTDFSPVSKTALLFAESVARRYGSKLTMAHVISPLETRMVPPEGWGACQRALEDAANFQMGELEQRLQTFPHECVVRHGLVWDAIAELIEQKEADLVVMGTHGRSGVERLLMGSVAEEVFRQAPCPVITIGPKVAALAPPEPDFKRIVLATNFNPESLAVPYALSLAQEFQALLTIVNMVPAAAQMPRDLEHIVDSRIRVLRAMVEPEADLWCKPEYLVRFGPTADGILEVAAGTQADLVVLGVHSASGHLGAATHAAAAIAHVVVSRAHCPVLTVRGTPGC